MIADVLRPPGPLDASAAAYKDWFHLNVFDRRSGGIGVFNASVHGAPGDARARAIGTALFHIPDRGWIGNVEVAAIADIGLGPSSIAMRTLALALDARDGVLVSAELPADGLRVALEARPASAPVEVERRIPFGSGWISWTAIPRLRASGEIHAADRSLTVVDAAAYHDHNWGRWHWGDDAGWEWGAFLADAGDTTFVVSRVTDRAHRSPDGTALIVDAAGIRRRFGGTAVAIERGAPLETTPRRLPGALAALHQDRARPRLPGQVVIQADDGIDRCEIHFQATAAAQLIAGDPVRRGYGFIHEIAGRFHATAHIGERDVAASGLAIFEYVD